MNSTKLVSKDDISRVVSAEQPANIFDISSQLVVTKFSKSSDCNELHTLNILAIDATEVVSNPEPNVISVSEVAPKNIEFISVANSVLKLLKFTVDKEVHPVNIPDISVTLYTDAFVKSISVKLSQDENILDIFNTLNKFKLVKSTD